MKLKQTAFPQSKSVIRGDQACERDAGLEKGRGVLVQGPVHPQS